MIRNEKRFLAARKRHPQAKRNDYWSPEVAAQRSAGTDNLFGMRNHVISRRSPWGRSRYIPAGSGRNIPEGNR